MNKLYELIKTNEVVAIRLYLQHSGLKQWYIAILVCLTPYNKKYETVI